MPSTPPALTRLLFVAGAMAALLVAGASAAAAHVEATSDGPAAPGGAVTISFDVAAESDTAGIASIRAQLPAGVPPEWVSLVSGPAGWSLTRTADGYELTGPPLAPHVDAQFGIHLGQLPTDRSRLGFPTWVRYTDGEEDAWTDVPSADNQSPQHPAPTITVPTAAPGPAGTSAAPDEARLPTEPMTAVDAQRSDRGGTAGLVLIAVLVVAALGVAIWYRRARSRPPS